VGGYVYGRVCMLKWCVVMVVQRLFGRDKFA
jgi:hypothetical protein